MDRRTFLVGTASAALVPVIAQAEDAYPTRAITILNAFPPGGANDLVTRPIASALEPIF
jgi:tripartite-type tricarboxylate transporter receptor subunit TctC